MLTGYHDCDGKEIRIGDKWEFMSVVYTVVNEDGDVFFEHPSDWASSDDDIEIEHSILGQIVA